MPPVKLAHGLHLLRLVELLARSLQRVLLGDVAVDGRIADEAAIPVVHQVDDDIGEEAAAILAHPPAFGLVPPVPARRRQRLLRLAGLAVLVGEEACIGLAEDLVAGVALGTLGTQVPAGDAAVRIEREDRIVHDAVDQQPEALLALPQRLLVDPAVGDVAGDLGKAAALATGVLQPVDHDAGPEPAAVLADAPPLGGMVAKPGGDCQAGRRQATRDILVHEEACIGVADDLAGGVTLEPLSARVPGKYDPVGVEPIDCIVGDTLDEIVACGGDGLRRKHVGHVDPVTTPAAERTISLK